MKSLTTSCVAAFLLSAASVAFADGTVTHLSGAVSVQRVDGSSQPASAGMKVAVGETLMTGAGGYARLEMTDGSEMVLRPESQMKIDSYKFADAKPAEDNFFFSMLKGGIRTVTGLIGKRGNRDAYQLKTPTATIGIRGTQYDARLCQGNCGALPDGTYVAVRFGAVHTSNQFGGVDVAAGRAAHVPQSAPPAVLPRDPGIGFTPPPAIPKLDEKKKQNPPPADSPAPPDAKAPPPAQASDGGENCVVE